MYTRDDPTIIRRNDTAFEAPALIPLGDAENVVLGIPWGGDDYFGFTPPRFEFQVDEEEDDKSGAACRSGSQR